MTPTEQITGHAFEVILVLILLGVAAYRAWRNNKPTRPAYTNSARWEPSDWPRCGGAHCNLPGTNHIVWTRSFTAGDLCPGHRDTYVAKGLAVDAWDNAS